MIDLDKDRSGGCGHRPELLPWTRFTWCAISKTTMLTGTTQLEKRPSELTLRTRILGTAASMSQEIGVTWDPFNLELLIMPTKNQPGKGAQ